MATRNFIAVLGLTTTVGFLADGASLFLSAVIGILIAVLTNHKFMFRHWKKCLIVLAVALTSQFAFQLIFNFTFWQERIAFMCSPLIFVFALRLVLESNYRIYIEHCARMLLIKLPHNDR